MPEMDRVERPAQDANASAPLHVPSVQDGAAKRNAFEAYASPGDAGQSLLPVTTTESNEFASLRSMRWRYSTALKVFTSVSYFDGNRI
jgi:hypothetical protein